MHSGPHEEAAVSGKSIVGILREEDEETFAAAQKIIMQRILQAILDEALNDLGTPEAIAEQAFRYLDEAHPAFRQAVALVKEQLMERATQRATEELALPTAPAREVDQQPPPLPETAFQETQEPPPLPPSPPQHSPRPPRRARRSYVKTPVIERRDKPSASAAEQPEPVSPSPALRRQVANGYTETALTPQPSEQTQALEDTASIRHFVYCIVTGAHRLDLADALTQADIEEPYTPYLMQHEAVTAIVGELPSTIDLNDEQHLNEVLRIQERILDHVNAADFVVLPMYAPTMHTSSMYLEKALSTYGQTLRTALDTLTEHQEWNVKIYCDPAKVEHEIEAHNEAIEGFIEEFASMADIWSELGAEAEIEAVREGLEESMDETINAILSNCYHYSQRTLRSIVLDSRVTPVSQDSVFGSNRMVLHASYLVEEPQGAAFRAALEHLSNRYEKLGLVYYIGGPHPPCRFAPPELPTL